MEPEDTPDLARQATEIGQGILGQVEGLAQSLLRPWNAYQIAIALGLLLLAHLVAKPLAARWDGWLRTRENWPMWRKRFGLMLRNRMRLVLFVGLIWPTVWIMQEMTWPSRSYLLGIIAQLTLAWLLITVASRLIVNSFLRGVVRYAGWIWVTLSILGLTDEARSLLDGIAVTLGETRLSAWIVLQAAAIIGALFFVARFVAVSSASRIRRNEDISPSMQVLAVKFLQLLLYGAAFFTGLRMVGVDLTGLAVLSGAIGVGLGFGLQKVVSNLVSGVIILLDKSIKPGDVISLGETFGWINTLGARYTSVVTRDGREYLIPNEDLITGQVVNWSHSNEFVRLDIYFGTSYGDDPHKVRKIAIDAAKSVDRVLGFKPPVCHIVGFGDSSIDYILRFWISDPTGGLTNIRGNVYLALWDAFHEHGISIPFPQRELRILNDPDDPARKGPPPTDRDTLQG
ncbi:mechanosensitive ion channel [Lutimaribacter sp. EGI FJ00015]|uniref:Mechanosensitive ion channel n=1 Tax=Lutimaribacter degradans TaxID=2945989 RepID=A0ACC5ZW03_9RHOB|nr:mechanosensitive ion channel domain-containing protein [Lutimaribacter sp. EGI FJ00013]MCM2561569.1 mechanosensitive ion channel [Lutimaribacter sp. EGI FJ00013]MCO0612720.1 mechanosensitive ion channel [Lutimaribacter sp. EGI FJ00015]MCO0635378.1 mechanosensitive ion channel [Lutimaribacter sp. EGI FJ00014]